MRAQILLIADLKLAAPDHHHHHFIDGQFIQSIRNMRYVTVYRTRKLSSIETAFRTEPLTLSCDLSTFNPMRAVVMTHTHAQGQVQKLLGSKVRVETDKRERLPC